MIEERLVIYFIKQKKICFIPKNHDSPFRSIQKCVSGGKGAGRNTGGDAQEWTDGGEEEETGVDGWMERERDGGGAMAVAIILHRFGPVRDGWTRNEVWDLGVSACSCLLLIAFLDAVCV